MRMDIRRLLEATPAVRAEGTRVGLPDGDTPVDIAQPADFAARLDALMRDFRELRLGTQTLVSADVNDYRREVWIRLLQNGPHRRERNGQVETSLGPSLAALRAVVVRDGGEVHYWGGNNYLDVSLPYPTCDRECLLDVDHLPWDERHRVLLERESWGDLRDRVFRWSRRAVSLADRCLSRGVRDVLVPSVGLCVHPWLFASRGLTVTATDAAATALAALSAPDLHPNLYSTGAYERWDTAACASYAMIPQPDHFGGMPALEDAGTRDALRQRITFAVADWARLPVPSGSIDLVFAANALPRDSEEQRAAVLREWDRVLRPGGFAFIAQHHAADDWAIEAFFRDHGYVQARFLADEQVPAGARGAFETYYTSG
jgi:SAM-dependent methyltransferase